MSHKQKCYILLVLVKGSCFLECPSVDIVVASSVNVFKSKLNDRVLEAKLQKWNKFELNFCKKYAFW